MHQAAGLLALARCARRLKSVRRTGWLDRGVDPINVESVADHTLGVALLAWAAAVERNATGGQFDADRVLKLALLHDLAEAETGDLPPYDPGMIPGWDDAPARREFLDRRHIRDDAREVEKRAAEDASMQRLLASLPNAVREEMSGIWIELRAGSTAEARLVKQADRLETFLQSRAYRQENLNLPVDSFRREVMETVDDPVLAAVRDTELSTADV
jgi:putative hydrolase of HD superfamily